MLTSPERQLLNDIVAMPNRLIGKPASLSDADKHKLLVEWNDTRADYPESSCVHELLEEQAQRTPEAIAVVCGDRQLNYRQLNTRANQLAHELRKQGAAPGQLVGICLERSLEMIVALLGSLKSGAAYVPLDPYYPVDRLSWMVQDSELKILITDQNLQEKFPEYWGRRVFLDSHWTSLSRHGAQTIPHLAGPQDLAYVIYTSGSTGKPKGVQISHRSLVNFLVSMRLRPGLTAQDTLLAVTTISFDIAALELYLPLLVGARLRVATREITTDGYALKNELPASGTTVMQATPATWRLLLEAGWQGDQGLKVLCGGEAMPGDLARELLKRTASVWNMYGPTEATVWSTTSRVTQSEGPITIGRPIANTQTYVLDDQLDPVPVGVAGELYIGGEGLARGYLHRPDLTAEKFIASPFQEKESGARLYRTGDLARYLQNGDIECLGRIDHQVKVRGFRIELGEIESVLASHPSIRQNVVVAREDAAGEKRLVAYAVAKPGTTVFAEELRKFAERELPEYMLPSQFEFLNALPLTPNGKVDRAALPTPGDPILARRTECVAPRDTVESQLVEIWQSILSIRTVGIKENFFELGGHSILVARLLAQIDRVFGKKLSMAAVLLAPTIEQQAAAIRNGVDTLRSAVLPVQPNGSRTPFFCCGFHVGPVFLPLARRLGSDQPLLAIDPTLLNTSSLSASLTMEDIAACLVKQIREIQPDGPYYLGGFCAGGLMVYEMARQLVKNGQQVALLALFEPQTPADYNGRSTEFKMDSVIRKMKFHLQSLQQLDLKEARLYVRDRTETFLHYMRRLSSGSLRNKPSHPNNGRLGNFEDILFVAYRNYRPEPFPGPVALFRAANRLPGTEADGQFWTDLAEALEVHEIPGFSNWVLRFFVEPNVQILASTLSRYFAPGLSPEFK
jgi:amino acid adenylation domain-containing protein